jgi:hypothetical protein
MPNRSFLLLLASLIFYPSITYGWEEHETISSNIQDAWLADHLATVRRTSQPRSTSLDFTETKIWTRGLKDSAALTPVPRSDKAMGAKLRPFKEVDLVVGTELSESRGIDPLYRSELNWQLSWSQRLDSFAGLRLGLATTGAVESLQGGFTQGLKGSLGVQLPSQETWGNAQIRLSPQLSFDALNGTWRPSVVPELVSDTVLNSSAAPLKTLLSLRVGSDLTPETQPSASARVELKIVPRR